MSIRELISQFGEKYLAALVTTYKLTLSAFLLAVVLGVVITVFRLSPIRPLRVHTRCGSPDTAGIRPAVSERRALLLRRRPDRHGANTLSLLLGVSDERRQRRRRG